MQHRATVIKKYESAKFVGFFVELTAVGDDSETPAVIASVPCETEDQAWAACDAFNHPESNSNDWRMRASIEDVLFGDVSQETIDLMDCHFSGGRS